MRVKEKIERQREEKRDREAERGIGSERAITRFCQFQPANMAFQPNSESL